MTQEELLAWNKAAEQNREAFYPTTQTTTDKLQTLEQKRKEKLDRLGTNKQKANLDASYTIMPEGNIESNKNKIWNTMSDAQMQDMLSDAANKSLYRDETGKLRFSETGEEYAGDTRRAYLFGTKAGDESVKFGLARGDLPGSEYRYQPGRAEKEGFNVGKDGYGWDAGDTGVDVNKKYMDMLLPYDVATALEGAVHGREEALKNRKYPDYLSDKALQHASGVSEYYNDVTGVLGDTSKASKKELEAADTNLLDEYRKQVPVKGDKKELSFDEWKQRKVERKHGFVNAVKGFTHALGEGIVNTVDLVPEIAEYAYGNIVGDKKWKDVKGLYDEPEGKAFKEWLGYNDKVVNTLGKDAAEAISKARKEGDYWGLVSTLGEAVTTPELLGVSLGYVAGMILPGSAANKLVRVASGVNKSANAAVKADTTGKLTKAMAIEQAEEKAGPVYKALSLTADNVGFINEAEQFGRDAEKLYQETYGEEMPTEQRLLARPLGLLYAKLDAITAKAILKGTDPVSKLVPELVKQLPAKMQTNFAGKVAIVSGSTAAKVAGVMGIEGGTEAIQTAMEQVAGKYKAGEVGVGEVLAQNTDEIGAAGLLGAAGGIQMKSPELALDAAVGAKDFVVDKLGAMPSESSTGVPSTVDGRRNRFTAVGEEGFEVAPEAKQAFEDSIVGYMADVLFDPEELKNSGYLANPGKVIDDGVAKAAMLRGVESEEEKKAVEAEVLTKLFSYASDTKKDADITKKAILDKAADNDYVLEQVTDAYKDKLKNTVDVITAESRLDVANSAFSEEDLVKVKEVTDEMRKFGSEKLTKLADTIDKGLEVHQKTYGSQEGKEPVEYKKTIDDVAAEVESLGFLLNGKAYKSVGQHAKDMDLYVSKLGSDVKSGSLAERQEETLKALEGFADSRGIGKLTATYVDSDSGKVVLRKVGQIVTLAKKTLEEDKSLLKVVDDTLKSDKVSGELRDRVVAIKETLDGAIKEQSYLIEMARRGMDKEVINAVTKSGEVANVKSLFKGVKKSAAEVEEQAYKNAMEGEITGPLTIEDVKGEAAAKVPTVKVQAEQKETDGSVQKAVTDSVVKEEKPDVASPKQAFEMETLDELKSHSKFNELIEMLKDASSEDTRHRFLLTKTKIKRILAGKATQKDIADLKNDLGIMENDPKFEAVKEDPTHENELDAIEYEQMVAKDTAAKTIEDATGKEYSLSDIEAEVDKEISSKEEVTAERVDKAISRAEMVEQMIARHVEELGNLKTKRAAIKAAIKAAKEAIKLEEGRVAKAKRNLKEANRLLDGKASTSAILSAFNLGLKYIKQAIGGLKGALTRAKNRLLRHKSEIDGYRDKLFDVKRKIGKTISDIRALKEALPELRQEAKTDKMLNGRRDSLTSTINKAIKDGKSLAEMASVVMEIMPKIIRTAENGLGTVMTALKLFERFEEKRSNGGFVVQINPEDSKFYNPLLKEYAAEGGRVVKFADIFDNASENRDEVKRALNMATVITMKSMLDSRTMPTNMIEDMVEGSFGNVLDNVKTDDGKIDYVARMRLAADLVSKVRSGEIVPLARFRQEAGHELLGQLGIKLDGSVLIGQEMSDIVTALGELVINNALPDPRGQNRINEVKREVVVVEGGKVVVRVGKQAESGDSISAVRVFNTSGIIGDTAKEIATMGRVFEYAAEVDNGSIDVEPAVIEYGTKGRNSGTAMSKETVDYLNKQNKTPWRFNEDFVNGWKALVSKYGIDAATSKMVEGLLGNKKQVINSKHPLERDSVKAKYEAQELEIQRMLMAVELVGDKGFYVNWDYTVSNRNMISNRMFNPQNSKISRFLAYMPDMANKLIRDENGKFNKLDIHMIKVALAQAFELGVDKVEDSEAFDKLDKLVEISEDGDVVIPDGSPIKEAIERGNLLNLRRTITGELAKEISSDNIGHMYQAIKTIRKLMDKEAKEVDVHLALEADGITNGMATTLMQMGWTPFTREFLQRAGIYEKGGEFTSHGQYRSAGKDDIYMSPIDAFKEAVHPDIVSSIGNIIGGAEKKKWRNFMKPLVMVFIYGAGINNIRAKAALELVTTAIIENKLGDLKSIIELAGEDAALISGIVDKKGNYNMVAINKIANVVNDTIGDALAAAFNSTFSEVNAFRTSVKMIEEINYAVFKSELRRKLKEAGAKNGLPGEVTVTKLNKIKDEMIKEGTYYSTTNSVGGEQDYYKTDVANGFEDANKVSVTINTGSYQTRTGFSREISNKIKDIIANVGAVGVTTVHSIDGAVMIKGHIKDVLNIYDALVLGIGGELNVEQMREMNRAFYEINTQHSILGEAVNKLIGNLSKIPTDKISNADRLELEKDFKRILGTTVSPDMVNVLGWLKKMVDNYHESRLEMGKQSLVVNQYYVSEAMPGYEANGIKANGVFKEGKEEISRVMLDKALNKFLAYYDGYGVKEDVKAENGIIDKNAEKLRECK